MAAADALHDLAGIRYIQAKDLTTSDYVLDVQYHSAFVLDSGKRIYDVVSIEASNTPNHRRVELLIIRADGETPGEYDSSAQIYHIRDDAWVLISDRSDTPWDILS